MSEKVVNCSSCTQEEKLKYDEIANIIDLFKDKEGSLIQILLDDIPTGVYPA